ncbi:MAG: hypothetical protein QM739_03995 [Propionivibrio sp.]
MVFSSRLLRYDCYDTLCYGKDQAVFDVKGISTARFIARSRGLLERTDKGELFCPFADIHVDMHLLRAA